MNFYKCPVCNEKLYINNSSYTCCNNHCFDLAKSGYVNLFQSKGKKNIHGDNKLMVKSRRDFLDKNFYDILLKSLCETVENSCSDGDFILDAGCGEGYYTYGVYNHLKEKYSDVNICGIDVSKDALDFASKRCKQISYAVGSIFNLPILDKSSDLLITLFAPYCGEEFQRVLKENGILIMVIPSENHLWELKKAIYETPYKNEVKDYNLDGFEFLNSEKIHSEITLDNQQDIANLFTMTPYYYKTGKTEQQKLNQLTKITTQIEFEILTYKLERK